VVSAREPYEWNEGAWELGAGYRKIERPSLFMSPRNDYGMKRNSLRLLSERGCRVTVSGADAAKTLLAANLTAFPFQRSRRSGALRLRHRGDTRNRRYRHAIYGILPGAINCSASPRREDHENEVRPPWRNHPVKDLDTGKVVITSQNHGFAVDPASFAG